jgi:hypothetical protein
MKLVSDTILLAELREMAKATFGNLVKAVVDVEKELIVVDAELHSDQESFLLDGGSLQMDLWGINFYPEFPADDENFIEFDSMTNLRPSDNNKSRYVEDEKIREKIIRIVRSKVR